MIQKTTLIVLVLTVLVVSWVGGTLFFRYMSENFHLFSKDLEVSVVCDKNESTTVSNEPEDIQTDVSNANTDNASTEKETLNNNNESIVENSASEKTNEKTNEEKNEETDEPKIVTSITKDDLFDAGFKNVSLQVAEFSGIYLTRIDIRDYINEHALDYRIIEAPEDLTKIVELVYPETKIASEIYKVLKEEFTKEIGFVINETGQYGTASFFVNNTGEKNSVFLVVQIDNYIYTFNYLAKNHSKIKNVINLLNNGT